MAEINFNSILDGVSLALKAAFPDASIHGGHVKQSLAPGDLNVVMPGASHDRLVGERYARSPQLDVIYYPKEGPVECYAMAQELTLVLGSITTPEGDVVHSKSCKWEITDDVLHVLVQYDHHVRIPAEPVYMETLTIRQEG